MVGSCYQNCSVPSSLARSSMNQSKSCPPVFLNKVVTKLEEGEQWGESPAQGNRGQGHLGLHSTCWQTPHSSLWCVELLGSHCWGVPQPELRLSPARSSIVRFPSAHPPLQRQGGPGRPRHRSSAAQRWQHFTGGQRSPGTQWGHSCG